MLHILYKPYQVNNLENCAVSTSPNTATVVQANALAANSTKEGHYLWELMKHVFIGVGVFLLLAIPAVALDLFNQGVELIEIQRSTGIKSSNVSNNGNTSESKQPQNEPAAPIRVSQPVKFVLHIVEYLILAVDVIFVGAYVINGMLKYLKSLKW